MISRYNTLQVIGSIYSFLLGITCFALAYLFFRHVPPFVSSQFDYTMSHMWSVGIAAGCLLLLTFSGYRVWKSKGGLYSYHESALYHNLGCESAGAFVIDRYAHRVTGSAYLLSQIFLAGPLFVLHGVSLLASRIPHRTEVERRVEEALAALRAANRWQSIDDYPSMRTEILYLAQMGKIDFSAHKGTPRIKAR